MKIVVIVLSNDVICDILIRTVVICDFIFRVIIKASLPLIETGRNQGYEWSWCDYNALIL